MFVLIRSAWADAIAPGPPLCPPGFHRTISGHAEVCEFDAMTAALEGGVLIVVIGVIVGIALLIKK